MYKNIKTSIGAISKDFLTIRFIDDEGEFDVAVWN